MLCREPANPKPVICTRANCVNLIIYAVPRAREFKPVIASERTNLSIPICTQFPETAPKDIFYYEFLVQYGLVALLAAISLTYFPGMYVNARWRIWTHS